ncbi:MAG: hypothetical protein WA064_00835 [Candidatus Moraniibacteriota bacterium]
MNQRAQKALAEFYGEVKWYFLAEGQISREHAWYAKGVAKCLKLGISPKLISGVEDRVINEKYLVRKHSYTHSIPEEVMKIAA